MVAGNFILCLAIVGLAYHLKEMQTELLDRLLREVGHRGILNTQADKPLSPKTMVPKETGRIVFPVK